MEKIKHIFCTIILSLTVISVYAENTVPPIRRDTTITRHCECFTVFNQPDENIQTGHTKVVLYSRYNYLFPYVTVEISELNDYDEWVTKYKKDISGFLYISPDGSILIGYPQITFMCIFHGSCDRKIFQGVLNTEGL